MVTTWETHKRNLIISLFKAAHQILRREVEELANVKFIRHDGFTCWFLKYSAAFTGFCVPVFSTSTLFHYIIQQYDNPADKIDCALWLFLSAKYVEDCLYSGFYILSFQLCFSTSKFFNRQHFRTSIKTSLSLGG